MWGMLPLGYTVLTCVPDERSGIEVDLLFLRRDGLVLTSLRNELTAWGGRLPVDLVHPLRRCAAYSIQVPCPAQFEALLSHWVGGEYRTTEWCLALPNWGSAERFTSNPRHHTMIGGLTNSHIAKLVDIWQQIDQAGLTSMSSVWTSSSACLQARSELARKQCIGCDVQVEAEVGHRSPKSKRLGNIALAKAFIGHLQTYARPAEGLLLRQCPWLGRSFTCTDVYWDSTHFLQECTFGATALRYALDLGQNNSATSRGHLILNLGFLRLPVVDNWNCAPLGAAMLLVRAELEGLFVASLPEGFDEKLVAAHREAMDADAEDSMRRGYFSEIHPLLQGRVAKARVVKNCGCDLKAVSGVLRWLSTTWDTNDNPRFEDFLHVGDCWVHCLP